MLAAAAWVSASPSPKRRAIGKKATRQWQKKAISVILVVALIFFLFGITFPLVVSGALIVATIVNSWNKRRLEASQRREQEEISTALGSLAGDLRAGVEASVALENVAQNLPESALKDTLMAASRSSRIGGSASAYWQQRAVAIHGIEKITHAWRLSERYGIALAPLLEKNRASLDEDLRHAERTQAALQGAKATAYILTALPFVGILLGRGMGVNALGFLFHTRIGAVLLILGTLLVCVGNLWSQAIMEKAR
ncbi:type II secretion system F family protein [Corynebacterium pseudotuberculosis]|nr:hypothetical protein CP162_01220 [Corynebacterium pseudotuberculosis Cp162]APG80942.1 Hypothetical protein CPI37_0240 [Corynebacterium pseudotuberculosis]